MSNRQYHFNSPLASKTMAACEDGLLYNENPDFVLPDKSQIFCVSEDLKALFGERNRFGQTLLYCLLRFTKDPEHRDQFLYAATSEQLFAQNYNCGSTALMGYFYGESVWKRTNELFLFPVSQIFDEFRHRNADKFPKVDLLCVAKIANNRGETALNYAIDIAARLQDDLNYFLTHYPVFD